jgi:hypothetical protein
MSGGRSLRVVVLGLMVVAPLVASGVEPALASGSCIVKNRTSGAVYAPTDGASLQTAIDDALEGEALAVRGRCVGSYTVQRSLALIGVGTDRYPRATIDADGGPYALYMAGYGDLRLQRLKITGGHSTGRGGGIINEGGGSMVLSDTWVTGNRADLGGGGIFHYSGDLQLFDSRVSRNRSSIGGGGGIYAYVSSVSLNGRSSIDHNFGNVGGGIESGGAVDIYDSSHVNGNLSFNSGGGVFGGQVTLHDHARISGNQAGTRTGHTSAGGGVFGTLVMMDASMIVNNVSMSEGGGAFTDSGTIEMLGESRIAGNIAPNGGGIASFGGTVTMSGGSTIGSNAARRDGGGIWFQEGALTMSEGASIVLNTARGGDPATPDGIGGGVRTCGGTALTGATAGANVATNVPDDIADCH